MVIADLGSFIEDLVVCKLCKTETVEEYCIVCYKELIMNAIIIKEPK